MTKSSVASKLAEVNHPVAVPPQWLPVLFGTVLFDKAPPPPSPPCTDNGEGGTSGRGDWPPVPKDPSAAQCVDSATLWGKW
eukprot:scaffold31022_cov57-Phaeocystis_antarctica.AAC.1